MKPLRLLTALALLLAATRAAFAAEVVFPPGLRIGIAPMVGLVPAKTFLGFETEDQSVKVLVAELPVGAYGEVMNALKANPAMANGANIVHQYSMIVSGGTFSGYVVAQIPENASKIYNDEAVRQMFASAKVRKEVPTEEVLGLMPFKVTALADFKNVRSLGATGALLLADDEETKGFEAAPFMVIGLMGATPAQNDDRARFAEQAARSIPGMHSGRITMSEPQRIDGMAGYETRIDATSGRDDTPVTVVQWLRFGSGGTLRTIGSAPRDQWEQAFPRFRAVRDGIAPR